MTEVDTLGDALPREMARVRDVVMPAYSHPLVGNAGLFALTMIRFALDEAARAMAEGDTIAMLRAYERLRGFGT